MAGPSSEGVVGCRAHAARLGEGRTLSRLGGQTKNAQLGSPTLTTVAVVAMRSRPGLAAYAHAEPRVGWRSRSALPPAFPPP